MDIKSNIQKIPSKLPNYVSRVADILLSNGYQAYLVGGSVRDLILGKNPGDYDIATNAYPDQIEKLFPKSIATGAKFGTIVVVMEDETGERFDLEVTTFRNESDYFGGRWPAKVEFARTIEEDLARRDFTINAIAINLDNITEDSDYLEAKIIDPFQGLSDIENKIIRAVGDPVERFTEDGLRTIRACRFSSVLNFEIDQSTFSAIKQTINVTKMVSIERVRDEFNKMIKKSSKPSKGFRLLDESGLLEVYIPELIEAKKFYQPEYHADNVYEHSLKAMDLAEDDIKWAALLHDIGKIKTQTVDEEGTHYYGHDVIGAEMAKDIMKRLRFSNNEIARTSNLIRWHMFYYPSAEWRKDNNIEEIDLENLDDSKVSYGWSDAAVRRFLKNIGGPEVIDDLIRLRIADATSNPKGVFDTKEVQALQERISNVLQDDMALKISDLSISGKDLIQLGYNPGPEFKKILNFLLDKVIDEPSLNSKEILIDLIKENF